MFYKFWIVNYFGQLNNLFNDTFWRLVYSIWHTTCFNTHWLTDSPNWTLNQSRVIITPVVRLSLTEWSVSSPLTDSIHHLDCLKSKSSQSYIATDGRSISKSWCRAPSGAHDHIFIIVWQLRPCFCGAPSLTRGRVCLLYMLLVFASAVFLGSESLGSRYHILLSQFWDFPFRRLLRLAGSQ
jgi:hypothetical protein